MAKKPEATNDDDINPYAAEGAADADDDDGGLEAAISKIMGDDEDDDGGFDQPAEEGAEKLDVVSPEKGNSMVEDAQLKSAKGNDKDPEKPADAAKKPEEKADAKADPKDGKDKAEDTTDKPEDGAKEEGDAPDSAKDLSGASIADLVKDVPETTRAEITKRLGDASTIATMFKERADKGEFNAHAVKNPVEAVTALMDLNAYAQANGSDYIAWFASEMGGDKAEEMLSAAAKRLGLQVTKAEAEDDDPFKTDRERELEAELNELRKKQGDGQPDFGPNAPALQRERAAAQTIAAVQNELDPVTGQLKRPYWGHLQHQIAEKARAHLQAGGRPVTGTDLARFYDESVADMQRAFGGDSAGKPPADVAKEGQDDAASAEKRKASKMIDGSGPGASRRPALDKDASLDTVLRHFAGS